MATTVGWILGYVIFPGIGFVASGFTVGILQWLVLKPIISKAWRWILVSAIGWAIGASIAVILGSAETNILTSSMIGIGIGIAQWFILRPELQWADWWIPICLVSWTTGLTLFPGFLSSGALAGAISGIALVLLLPYPRKISTDSS
jgi:hypothetical protein